MEGMPKDKPPDHVTHFGSFYDEFGHADDPRKNTLVLQDC